MKQYNQNWTSVMDCSSAEGTLTFLKKREMWNMQNTVKIVSYLWSALSQIVSSCLTTVEKIVKLVKFILWNLRRITKSLVPYTISILYP
jgi:hypothetical protein